MKILFFLMLICLVPCCLKAQDSTLGKTKDQIRAMVKPYPAIKLAPGDTADTLTMKGDLKTIVFYKNNVCYSSESILPLKLMDMVTQKMAKDGYKKVKDNVWISANGVIKVALKVDQKNNVFITMTTPADAGGSN
jgi:hypothetical protein